MVVVFVLVLELVLVELEVLLDVLDDVVVELVEEVLVLVLADVELVVDVVLLHRRLWCCCSSWYWPLPHLVHCTSSTGVPAAPTRSSTVQNDQLVHDLEFSVVENCPGAHASHTLSNLAPPSAATNWPS